MSEHIQNPNITARLTAAALAGVLTTTAAMEGVAFADTQAQASRASAGHERWVEDPVEREVRVLENITETPNLDLTFGGGTKLYDTPFSGHRVIKRVVNTETGDLLVHDGLEQTNKRTGEDYIGFSESPAAAVDTWRQAARREYWVKKSDATNIHHDKGRPTIRIRHDNHGHITSPDASKVNSGAEASSVKYN